MTAQAHGTHESEGPGHWPPNRVKAAHLLDDMRRFLLDVGIVPSDVDHVFDVRVHDTTVEVKVFKTRGEQHAKYYDPVTDEPAHAVLIFHDARVPAWVRA